MDQCIDEAEHPCREKQHEIDQHAPRAPPRPDQVHERPQQSESAEHQRPRDQPGREVGPLDLIARGIADIAQQRSEEHTSELQSLMRISYAVFCLQKKNKTHLTTTTKNTKHNTLHTN